VQSQSLFGHIVARFGDQPENIATESLYYILQEASAAREAFLRYIAQIGPSLHAGIRLETQTGRDRSARPDMVGKDPDGQSVLIVEAKFWAGLTGQQPVEYIRILPEDRDAILLFIAPEKRFATLWPELVRRCREAGFALGQGEAPIVSAWRIARLDSRRTLALASWRSLLGYLSLAVEAEHQLGAVSDIRQLQGLCDTMDATAFLPLRSEELTGDTGTRITQYCQLVDDVTGTLINEQIASVKGLKATGARGAYLRYMRVNEFFCCVTFDPSLWGAYRSTPIWFLAWDPGGKPASNAREKLARLEMEDPPRLILTGDRVSIPLYLPCAVERDEVLEALLAQMREIAGLLA
jgi:hypothetical protein